MKKTALLLLGLLMAFPALQAAESKKAVFAGGCFWCVEALFQELDGVSEAVSGFTGGTLKNPTYSGNHSGHIEAVEVTYDPDVISYQHLLDIFWVNIDPFDARGQFCDKGPSYVSGVFTANSEERELAEKSRAKVVGLFPKQKIVTPLLVSSTFWPIAGKESYHQDYYLTHKLRYKFYRSRCGRDNRLKDIWNSATTLPEFRHK